MDRMERDFGHLDSTSESSESESCLCKVTSSSSSRISGSCHITCPTAADAEILSVSFVCFLFLFFFFSILKPLLLRLE